MPDESLQRDRRWRHRGLRELFGSEADSFGLILLLFLEIDVLVQFIEPNVNPGHVEDLLAIRAKQSDLVLARTDAEGKVLAFFTNLERVLPAGIHAEPFHGAFGDWFSFSIANHTLH